jgi:hypothetical protein
MKIEKVGTSFKEILEIIIKDLNEGSTVIIPEVRSIVESIESFTSNEKIKEVCEKIIKVFNVATTITPDVIVLLEDLVKLLS